MSEGILTVLIGLLGGVAVGVQTPIANAIGRRVGGTVSSLVVHVSGSFFSALLLLRDREKLQDVTTLPWWMFCAGGLGVVLYLTINRTIPRLGASTAVALIILGQLFVGLIIDALGLFDVAIKPLDGTRLIAVVFLLIGGYLITK